MYCPNAPHERQQIASPIEWSAAREGGTHLGTSDALLAHEVVEELLEVDVEVVDLAVRSDEREHLPVRVRSLPQVPGVTCDLEPGQNLRADGLDAARRRARARVSGDFM